MSVALLMSSVFFNPEVIQGGSRLLTTLHDYTYPPRILGRDLAATPHFSLSDPDTVSYSSKNNRTLDHLCNQALTPLVIRGPFGPKDTETECLFV